MASIVTRWTTRSVVCAIRSKSRNELTSASTSASAWTAPASASGAMNDDGWNTPAWSIGASILAAALLPATYPDLPATCLRPSYDHLPPCEPLRLRPCGRMGDLLGGLLFTSSFDSTDYLGKGRFALVGEQRRDALVGNRLPPARRDAAPDIRGTDHRGARLRPTSRQRSSWRLVAPDIAAPTIVATPDSQRRVVAF